MTAVISPMDRKVVMHPRLHEGVFDMGNRRFENSDKLVAAESRRRVMIAAYPGRPGESVKAAIRRAAHRLSLPFSRTRALWYGLARRIDAAEMDQLCKQARYADAMKRRAEQHAQEVRAALFDRRQYSLDLDGGPHSPSRNAAE